MMASAMAAAIRTGHLIGRKHVATLLKKMPPSFSRWFAHMALIRSATPVFPEKDARPTPEQAVRLLDIGIS